MQIGNQIVSNRDVPESVNNYSPTQYNESVIEPLSKVRDFEIQLINIEFHNLSVISDKLSVIGDKLVARVFSC
jgi:hypothetical protein